ncbi:MAG: hypothetical protein HXY25_01785, partial [Alphaproteobacteria bacterium]|nr:hypothetical protein [Alphaproteobacteria bacterium]
MADTGTQRKKRKKPMTESQSWTLDGIDPAVRAAAEPAARVAGLTLGEWIEREVLARAEAPDADEDAPAGAPPVLAEQLQALEQRIDALDRRATISISGIDQAMDGVIRRLSRSEEEHERQARRADERLRSVEGAVRGAVQRVRGLESDVSAEAQRHRVAPLEAALKTLARHVETAERRHARSFVDIRAELKALAEQGPDTDSFVRQEALTALSARVAGLADRVDTIDLKRTSSLRSLEASVQSLTENLQDVERGTGRTREETAAQVESLRAEVDAARGAAVAAIEEVRAQLAGLEAATREAKAQARAAAQPGDLSALEARITESLVGELEEAVERTLVELTQRLDAASEKQARALDELDEKMGEMLARAERGQDATRADLFARLDELRKAGEDGLARLSSDVKALDGRVGVTEQRQADLVAENDARIATLLDRLVALEMRRLDGAPGQDTDDTADVTGERADTDEADDEDDADAPRAHA